MSQPWEADNEISELNEKLTKNFGDINKSNTSTHIGSEVDSIMIKKSEDGERKPDKLKCTRTLFSMCLIVGMSNSAYALLAPFMPLHLKGLGIGEEVNGYIFR